MYQSSDLADKVEIIWHGGEPLISGLKTFERVLDIQENISGEKNVLFRNKIQTNAILINSQWIDIFQRGNFGVGVSLDGPQSLHDNNRTYQSGRGSFHKTMSGIAMLKEGGISFSILSVLTKDSLGREQEILDFFVENGFRRFDFLPCIEFNSNQSTTSLYEKSLAKGDFAAFMIQIFDRWFNMDDPSISIRYFEEILFALLDNSPSLCKFSGGCKNFVTVNSDGNVFPCDNFVGYEELNFGNLQQTSLSDIVNGSKRKRFISAISSIREECQDCNFWAFCKGGCNKYSYMWEGNFRTENFLCYDRILIFSHAIQKLIKEHPNLYETKLSAKKN